MNGQKNLLITFALVLSVSLMSGSLCLLLACRHYRSLPFELINAVCGEVLSQDPESEKIIAAALKEYTAKKPDGVRRMDVLSPLGYRIGDFSAPLHSTAVLFGAAGSGAGVLLFLLTFVRRNNREAMRIRALTEYLEQVNTGKAPVLSASGEDDFSRLEDEIYKTVTFLCQTRDAAVQARNGFAENLSNIAHQIKTPITALSLSVQMMKQAFPQTATEQVEKQLLRLTRLEEALLLLSRIDAGTLPLQREPVDVFTLLVLASDNLQELSAARGVAVEIPEMREMLIDADLDWTMEAVMNLMKNCMEHGGKRIRCSCAENPLYTRILIRDDGKGFVREDIPHLFERFYRGQNAHPDGIGIGLSLSKEIIQRQNGTLRAANAPEGGAFFEIRFYRH